MIRNRFDWIITVADLSDLDKDKFPGCISLPGSISFVKRTSSFLRFTDVFLVAYSAKFKSRSLYKISKWELSKWPKVTKHHYATTILYFSNSCKTVDSKIQHFSRWAEFVMVWEIWILNLEGRSRCISFVSIGYETMTVIRARACAKPWKCPFNENIASIWWVWRNTTSAKHERDWSLSSSFN